MIRWIALLALASLAGCISAADLAQRDDAKCRSYGAAPGDAAYVNCRAQLDAARTIAANSGVPAQPANIQAAEPPSRAWHRF